MPTTGLELIEESEAVRTETTWDMLRASAAKAGDDLACVAGDDDGTISRVTYRELVDAAEALSEGLAGIGIRRGDRVVLWMTNRIEWIISYLALMRIGAVMVPVNTFLKPSEIGYIIGQSGARHLIMIDGFRKLDMPAMLTEICPGFGRDHLPGQLFDEALPELRTVIEFNRSGAPKSTAFDWRELARGNPGMRKTVGTIAAEVRPTDLAMVKYTSGSTGFPKGVMLEQGGIVFSGRVHSKRIGVLERDSYFSLMPLFHGGGSIWGMTTMLANAGKLIVIEAFKPDLAVNLIVGERPRILMSPISHEIIAEAERQEVILDSLIVAHAPGEAGARVMPNAVFAISPFGLTETYGPAAANDPLTPIEKRFQPRMLDCNELRVVDPETGEDLPPNTVGEAWIRGNIMRGYWNKPVETAKVLTEDGWLRSEDLIKVDEAGFITYVGRLKLMLKVGGENVSIEEVENVVTAHEEVTACCVVGVVDDRKGERARAYVTLRERSTLSDTALLDWLAPRLARFKMPREIIVLETMPRLGNGKLDRVLLKQTADLDGKAA